MLVSAKPFTAFALPGAADTPAPAPTANMQTPLPCPSPGTGKVGQCVETITPTPATQEAIKFRLFLAVIVKQDILSTAQWSLEGDKIRAAIRAVLAALWIEPQRVRATNRVQ